MSEEKIKYFLEYYHCLHDSSITKFAYDCTKDVLELYIDVYWSGEPTIKEDGSYETHKTKIKINFFQIREYKIENIYKWDDIDSIFLKEIEINDKKYICFSDDENNPRFFIVAEKMDYEEITL